MHKYLAIFFVLCFEMTAHASQTGDFLACAAKVWGAAGSYSFWDPKAPGTVYILTAQTILKKKFTAPTDKEWKNGIDTETNELPDADGNSESVLGLYTPLYKIDAQYTGVKKPFYFQAEWTKDPDDNVMLTPATSPNKETLSTEHIVGGQMNLKNPPSFGDETSVDKETIALLTQTLENEMFTMKGQMDRKGQLIGPGNLTGYKECAKVVELKDYVVQHPNWFKDRPTDNMPTENTSDKSSAPKNPAQ